MGNINEAQIIAISNHYGIENQLKKSLEELRELSEEIKTYLFDYQLENTEISTVPIVDEVADVKIMLAQIEYLLEIEKQVDDRIGFKLKRQMERIREEKENG